MKLLVAAIVLLPIGLMSMLLAFMTRLWIVLSYNLTLAITVSVIGLCFPVIMFIAIACFDSLSIHLYSSTQLLMSGLDTIERVDIYQNLRVYKAPQVYVLQLVSQLCIQMVMSFFIRGATLFQDPDERSYCLSLASFWLIELRQMYKYTSFSFYIAEQVTRLHSFSPLPQPLHQLIIGVVSRILSRNVSPRHSEQDSLP
ncbi:hypothetical protein WN943_022917 [Citrus x changshan-huyou]